MRSIWKIKKKYLRSFYKLEHNLNFKRSDIIPKVSHLGAKVSVYNVVSLFNFTYNLVWRVTHSDYMLLQLFMCSKVQQKWAAKKEKNKKKKLK